MKKYLLIIAFLFLFVFCVFLATDALKEDKSNNNDNTKVDNTLTNQGFTLTYSYVGNNVWNYKVTGTLPTPCDDITFDALIRESYPEQVVITGYPKKMDPDTVCIQVIKDFEKTGTVNASEKAVFQLIIALPD